MLGSRTQRQLFVRVVALGSCLLVLATACGSRLSEQEIVAKNSGSATQAVGVGPTAERTEEGAVGPTTETVVGSNTSGAATSDTSKGRSEQADGDGPATETQARKAPIRVGFIGALSGAAGVNVGPRRDGWVVWAKMINARGGINGHPIELLVGDDGTNDARGVAIARDFVENKGAVALSWSSNDISGLADYVEKKRVPIIGIVEAQDVWHESPMLFPTSGGGGWGTIRAAKKAGATKIAILYCVEAATCETSAVMMAKEAEPEGVEVVYRAGVSITQPDYTAECIQARNRDAAGVVLLVDENSTVRFMQSCRRQGYQPTPIAGGSDEMARLPEMDGLVSGGGTFPWHLRSGAPGIAEYAAALRKYAPKMLTSGTAAQTTGWVAAKIFEHAVENATRTSNPDRLTSEHILNGLWAMKGDALDGLAPGGLARTYRRAQATPPVYCTFVNRLRNGRWTSLTGLAPECRR